MGVGLVDVLILFVTQLVFIGARTVNVKGVASGNTTRALFSGAIVHLSWLVGIYYGTASVADIVQTQGPFNWYAVLAIAASTTGGLLGTYLGMREKQKVQEVKKSIQKERPRQVTFH